MANPEHVEHLSRGADEWNGWRKANPDVRPDLQEANLAGLDLSGMNLSHSNAFGIAAPGARFEAASLKQADVRMSDLRHTVFLGADLYRAAFCGSLFEGSDLRASHCNGTDFSGAHLPGADLSHASLWSTDFTRAELVGTDFDHALMGDTYLGDTDLSNARNLASAILAYPCVLDHRTLTRSKDIPLNFLRGCGLSEQFIASLPSLLREAVSLDSCFISYSSRDEELARKLYADLQDAGVRCWYAPENLKIGDRLRQTLDEQVLQYDRLLLVLSEASLGSQWVEAEVERALERERRESVTVLFPVRLDDSVFDTDGWAALLRNTRHIGDFREWQDPEKYQKGLRRLVRDLVAQ